MKLKLKKDFICFDCESTGLSVVKDRIIQLALTKYFADGREPVTRVRYINPGIPIPTKITDITGITDDMVRNQPPFSKLAKGLMELIGDADFLTYNGNRFDIPLLMEEFERCGMQLDMSNRKRVDALRIFHLMEPRTLRAAVRFYCNEKFDNAHDAQADTDATFKVLEAQIEKYEGIIFEAKDGNEIPSPVVNDIEILHDISVNKKELDFQGKVEMNEQGVPVFTFGKYQGMPVGENLAKDPKYNLWIQNGDFASDTKRLVARLMNEYIAHAVANRVD